MSCLWAKRTSTPSPSSSRTLPIRHWFDISSKVNTRVLRPKRFRRMAEIGTEIRCRVSMAGESKYSTMPLDPSTWTIFPNPSFSALFIKQNVIHLEQRDIMATDLGWGHGKCSNANKPHTVCSYEISFGIFYYADRAFRSPSSHACSWPLLIFGEVVCSMPV